MTTITRPNRAPRFDPERVVCAPHGPELHCKSWPTEAAYRMIQNNLDPDVAEDPKRLARVLVNDCGSGVMRYADAGYELAVATAKKQQGLKLPMIGE